jgi:pimeloyl-ACP methyl ester carboxylesterase
MKQPITISLVFLSLLGCSTAPAPNTRAPEARVSLQPTECFPAPGLIDGDTIRCKTVKLPMGGTSAGDVELFIAIIGRDVEGAAQAIFHMPGGPGASSESYAPILASTYLPLSDATGKPVVIVDQRGTGRSTPFLECADAPEACLEAWAAADIDPLAFTTPHAADDIAAVAGALGITSIDAWGASYGSRLALETARRHGKLVRSLVIEAVDTAASPLDDALDVRAALSRASTECASDPACRAVVPDLAAATDAAATALVDEPLPTQLGTLDAATFLSGVESLMMWARGTSLLPAYVAAVRDRDTAAVEALQGALTTLPFPGGAFSVAMNTIVNCNDLAPFDPEAIIAGLDVAGSDLLGQARAAQSFQQYSAMCAGWPIDPTMPTEPVTSDVPALVLAGAIDSNTPFENAELAAATLSNATVVAFPSTGHFVVHQGANPCGASILAAYLLDPAAAIDTSCIAAPQPVATLPAPAEATFQPTAIASLGFTADVPDGWVSFDGTSWRTAGGLLQFALLPGQVSDIISAVGGQVGLDPATASEVDVGGAPWTQLSGPGIAILSTQADTSALTIVVALGDGSDAAAFAQQVAVSIITSG